MLIVTEKFGFKPLNIIGITALQKVYYEQR